MIFSEYFPNLGFGYEVIFRLFFSVFKYFVAAGTGYFIFYVWKRQDWFKYKIQEKMPSIQHLQHEVFWSVISRIIIGFVIIGVLYFIGMTKVYFDVSEHGVPYLIFSIVAIIFCTTPIFIGRIG